VTVSENAAGTTLDGAFFATSHPQLKRQDVSEPSSTPLVVASDPAPCLLPKCVHALPTDEHSLIKRILCVVSSLLLVAALSPHRQDSSWVLPFHARSPQSQPYRTSTPSLHRRGRLSRSIVGSGPSVVCVSLSPSAKRAVRYMRGQASMCEPGPWIVLTVASVGHQLGALYSAAATSSLASTPFSTPFSASSSSYALTSPRSSSSSNRRRSSRRSSSSSNRRSS